PRFSRDTEDLRKWMEQQQPHATPTPAPQPKPKDKQQGCFEKIPYALPCEDQISQEEQVQEFLLRQGYSYESLGECRLMGMVDKVEVCNHGPGESWHCKVAPYVDPISKKRLPGGEVSIFKCVCCDKDGSTGFEWRGAHWSGGK